MPGALNDLSKRAKVQVPGLEEADEFELVAKKYQSPINP